MKEGAQEAWKRYIQQEEGAGGGGVERERERERLMQSSLSALWSGSLVRH